MDPDARRGRRSCDYGVRVESGGRALVGVWVRLCMGSFVCVFECVGVIEFVGAV